MSRHRIRTVILDVVLALAFGLFAVDQVNGSPIGVLPAAWGPPLAVAAGAALLFRRSAPIPVLVACVLADIAAGANLPSALALYTVANRYGNTARTWVSTIASMVAGAVPWGVWTKYQLTNSAPISVLFFLVPALLGLWINQRRQVLTGLRERAEQAERERDLRAAAAVEAERLRIASELHDIVAHRISQVTVLAGALEVSADGKPAEIAGTIRDTGARALAEMRELLGVLRTDAPLRPAPDLAAVRELVSDAVTAGQRIELVAPEQLPEVTGPVGRAVYRLVQEALTNAAKHAAGAVVRVQISAGDTVEVDVRNGAGERTTLAAEGSGFGLMGMRDRVELAGGTLHSGPLATGGFVIHASFPSRSHEQQPHDKENT
ncbi:sensor histidine kinase [Nocardia huaxiensis]|uniref:histidine kinase n=1 Tax=Nocardia huaxiensis TaxID=2755382 RepID=A0A7D6Z3S9_9NOCA|nr:histidine kinase [Nocardia huaxiensis]QLY30344.1 histidine kinase [Nocardia huaxiensis]UFS96020.1 histidine kinase [Nocardia huaxiensis]